VEQLPWTVLRGSHIQTLTQNLYIRHDVLFLLYVDDILVFHTNDSACEEIKKALKDKYKMSGLGPATKFLDLEIDRDEDGIP
jgi:hypothetical protein